MSTSSYKTNEPLLFIRIETFSGEKNRLDVGMLAAVLSALNTSFEGFMQIEMAKRYPKPNAALKKEIKLWLAESGLLIADFDLNRSTFAVTPNLLSQKQYRFFSESSVLKKEIFQLFNDTVFTAHLFSSDFVEQMSRKYSIKERIRIFQPVYDQLINQQNFNLNFGSNKENVNQSWLHTDDKETVSRLLPEPVKQAKTEVETYYQYVKTGEETDLFGKRSKYEKVLIKEAVAHDLYPYQLQKIRVNGKAVLFDKKLSAEVFIKQNQYCISLPELQISVLHEQRVEAEKAFDADLTSLIIRYEKANDFSADPKMKAIFLKLKDLITVA